MPKRYSVVLRNIEFMSGKKRDVALICGVDHPTAKSVANDYIGSGHKVDIVNGSNPKGCWIPPDLNSGK